MQRIAVVTGGTRGIGAAVSIALRDMGVTVVANYWKDDEAAQAFSSRTGISCPKWDVGDYEACVEACNAISEMFGQIDILVNNAGITRDAILHKMSATQWNEVIRVNLGGCFNMARAVFPAMRERRWGRIVNIASINAQAGQIGQTNYSAAKAGILGFTKALAQEGARFGITVNALAPGYIDTDMVAAVPPQAMEQILAKIPVGRLGQANEIARGVSFLCAEDAGFITGATFSLNGGQHMY